MSKDCQAAREISDQTYKHKITQQ